MYIYPNTTLKILRGVNLNNDYDHTIFFDGKVAQTEYFLSKAKYTLTNQSYQRKERGWIQVDINQNNLWDCTYIMYQNTSYNNKWFYAFILSVDYVNDNISKINFEIDVMQTWFFDHFLDKCFVEREHASTDIAGDNTIDEGLDLGPEYHVQANARYNLDCTRICVVEAGRWDPSIGTEGEYVPYDAYKCLNYYTGMRFTSFDLLNTNSLDELRQHLKSYIEHGIEDAIIAIYQYPRFMGEMPLSASGSENYGYSYADYAFHPNTVQIDGYIPKNRKLFTYPYNLIELDNGLGDTTKFKMELWDNAHIGNFRIYGTPHGIPSCACMPVYYNGEANSFQNALSSKINIQCAWSGDAYQVWLARNDKNIGLSMAAQSIGLIGGIIGAGVGIATENPALVRTAGGIAATSGGNLVRNIFSVISKKHETDATPDPVHGQIANDMLNLQSDLNHFAFRQKTIRQEYAKIIDEYFSRFGYACHRVKEPARKVRQNWTYTKTVGCEINGNIPSDDLVKLKSIYNHGVTFWTNGNNIGNYGDFTNPILS